MRFIRSTAALSQADADTDGRHGAAVLIVPLSGRRDRRLRRDAYRELAVAILEGFGIDFLELDRPAHDACLPLLVLAIDAKFRHHFLANSSRESQMSSWLFLPA